MYVFYTDRRSNVRQYITHVSGHQIFWGNIDEAKKFKSEEELTQYLVDRVYPIAWSKRKETTIDWMNNVGKISFYHPLNIPGAMTYVYRRRKYFLPYFIKMTNGRVTWGELEEAKLFTSSEDMLAYMMQNRDETYSCSSSNPLKNWIESVGILVLHRRPNSST